MLRFEAIREPFRIWMDGHCYQPVVKVQWAAFRAPQGQMQGGATQSMRDIVEERQRSRCPCAAGTLWAHRGCGQSLRCSSSTMSRIASSSRLDLASQALCARPIVLLPRADRHKWRNGATHVVFEPIDLIAKLAALPPHTRFNLAVKS